MIIIITNTLSNRKTCIKSRLRTNNVKLPQNKSWINIRAPIQSNTSPINMLQIKKSYLNILKGRKKICSRPIWSLANLMESSKKKGQAATNENVKEMFMLQSKTQITVNIIKVGTLTKTDNHLKKLLITKCYPSTRHSSNRCLKSIIHVKEVIFTHDQSLAKLRITAFLL